MVIIQYLNGNPPIKQPRPRGLLIQGWHYIYKCGIWVCKKYGTPKFNCLSWLFICRLNKSAILGSIPYTHSQTHRPIYVNDWCLSSNLLMNLLNTYSLVNVVSHIQRYRLCMSCMRKSANIIYGHPEYQTIEDKLGLPTSLATHCHRRQATNVSY